MRATRPLFAKAGICFGLTVVNFALAQSTAPTPSATDSAQARPAASTQPFIYPTKGQTAQQQQKDRTECNGWATEQTGFDPVQALQEQQAAAAQAQQQTQQAQQTAAKQINGAQAAPAGGAVKGAAAGAAIGAVAGNAGKGAAIGATTGVLAGSAARRQQQTAATAQQQQSQQQIGSQQAQQQAAAKQNLDNYNRAFKTCMQGRGYTVN